jgi:uncharacterized phage-like protein YoqJ
MNKNRLDNGYNDRVRRLSERLSSMQITLDSERTSRYTDIEKRLDNLEKEFSDLSEQSNKKFTFLKDNILKIEKRVDEEFQLRDQFFQSKSAEINSFQDEMQESLSKYLKGKKENESKIYKIIEDKFEGLKLKLIEESKNFKESEAEAKSCIEQDVPKLIEFVQNSVAERVEVEAGLNKKLDHVIGNIENDLVVETKTREETEEAMLAMLRDVVSRIKNDLDIERKEREGSEETLLGLLEETCAKISNITKY